MDGENSSSTMSEFRETVKGNCTVCLEGFVNLSVLDCLYCSS